jgi:hypothetical protein
MKDFRTELTELLDRHPELMLSNTPTYLMTIYLHKCMENFHMTVNSIDGNSAKIILTKGRVETNPFCVEVEEQNQTEFMQEMFGSTGTWHRFPAMMKASHIWKSDLFRDEDVDKNIIPFEEWISDTPSLIEKWDKWKQK